MSKVNDMNGEADRRERITAALKRFEASQKRTRTWKRKDGKARGKKVNDIGALSFLQKPCRLIELALSM